LKPKKQIECWHFLQGNKRLRFGKKQLVKVGNKIKVNPKNLSLCEYGLHGSIKPLDALSFVDWNNAYICRVVLSGKIIESEDKLCASERTVLWMKKVDKTLHEFSCWCAEQVLHFFEKDYPEDKRPRLAIEAKRKWLKKEITDEELAAAAAAADAAAWAADAAAAWAADAAARAARAAADDAAWAAAARAARAAADDAAWAAAARAAAAADAARDVQNKKLEEMFFELINNQP
jgi:hypothetical protein